MNQVNNDGIKEVGAYVKTGMMPMLPTQNNEHMATQDSHWLNKNDYENSPGSIHVTTESGRLNELSSFYSS